LERIFEAWRCYLAVSEITWITGSRPEEIEEYWNNEYPEIDNYYKPIEDRFDDFLTQHNNSENARKLVENEKKEIRIYKKYKEYFSYGFYIAKKLADN
jgi:hypothetical protein